ncbi:MAG: AAA family ATPase [Verrucomicrobiota bacterium]|jgi:BioD-like phosphotransacetylase family protein
MNTTTPRVFIAATRQNEGKTTTSLGLASALRAHFRRIGYIKPVGQRFVNVDEQKIDEDTILMDKVYQLRCPLVDMSPIAIDPEFTRKYLESANYDILVGKIQQAFDRVAWEKEFVLVEGSGHAGVGAVFDLSNARVAKLLNAKVIIVSQGGIGRPIDEVCVNQALFEKEGVEVIGVILNKVLPEKLDYIAKFARQGLKRKGLELLGVLPLLDLLSHPTMELIQEELRAELLNRSTQMMNLVEEVVVGAMSVPQALCYFKKGVLVITPGDREDIVLAAATTLFGQGTEGLAGILLTGGQRPSPSVMRVVEALPFPVLLSKAETYRVASKVHDVTIKTRPSDTRKIEVIRDLIAEHVDVRAIIQAVEIPREVPAAGAQPSSPPPFLIST